MPGKCYSCHIQNGRNSQAKCNCGYILKVEQIGFSDGLNTKCERNKRFKNGSKDFGLGIWGGYVCHHLTQGSLQGEKVGE